MLFMKHVMGAFHISPGELDSLTQVNRSQRWRDNLWEWGCHTNSYSGEGLSVMAAHPKVGHTRTEAAGTYLHQGLSDSIPAHIILRLSTPICYPVGMR